MFLLQALTDASLDPASHLPLAQLAAPVHLPAFGVSWRQDWGTPTEVNRNFLTEQWG